MNSTASLQKEIEEKGLGRSPPISSTSWATSLSARLALVDIVESRQFLRLDYLAEHIASRAFHQYEALVRTSMSASKFPSSCVGSAILILSMAMDIHRRAWSKVQSNHSPEIQTVISKWIFGSARSHTQPPRCHHPSLIRHLIRTHKNLLFDAQRV